MYLLARPKTLKGLNQRTKQRRKRMDIRIRKYIQYKIRTLNDRRQERVKLRELKEEMRQDIIDASPGAPDGQPKGKGNTGDPTYRKAYKLTEVDRRLDVLDKELKRFEEIEQKIKLMGKDVYGVYEATIKQELNPQYVALEVGMSERTLYNVKAKLLEYIATELGEYLNENELDKY